VSKNDYGFNISVFCVNEIHASVTAYSSIECSPCTGGCNGNCAGGCVLPEDQQYPPNFEGFGAGRGRSSHSHRIVQIGGSWA
jgi:hypothetical protein